MPSDWKKGTIIKLFKKDDALVCDNWKCINIMSIPSKLFFVLYSHYNRFPFLFVSIGDRIKSVVQEY